jgi:hypothetical protein
VTSVAPASGPAAGGTSVTITGTGFVSGATVSVGGTGAAGVTVAGATSITATTPAHASGPVNVVVTNPDGQSGTLANAFNYLGPPPVISSVSPAAGPSAGGAVVNITGSAFQSGAAVSFGGAAATSVTVTSGTSITATTPAQPSGSVTVTVTNPDGQSATLANGFRYTLLQDGFSTLDSSKWSVGLFTTTPNTNIGVNASGGQLLIGPMITGLSSPNYNGVRSVNTYNFTGAYAYMQFVQVGGTSIDEVLSAGPDKGDWYSFGVHGASGNTLQIQCKKSIAGTQTTLLTASYNSTNHQFLRRHHDPVAAKVVFETAPSSGGVPGAWTQQYSEAWNSSVTLTSLSFEIKAGNWNVASQAVTPAFANFQASKP